MRIVGIWLIGIATIVGISAIPSACLWFAFRDGVRNRIIPKATTGVSCGLAVTLISIFIGGQRGNSISSQLFIPLFLFLFPASGFFTAWAWGFKAIFYCILLAIGNGFLYWHFYPNDYLGSQVLLLIFSLIASTTGFGFGILLRRNGVVPN